MRMASSKSSDARFSAGGLASRNGKVAGGQRRRPSSGAPPGWRSAELLANVLHEQRREVFGIAGQRAALVPEYRQRNVKRLAPVRDTHDSQLAAVGPQDRRNDRDTVTGLRQRQQGMRCAAFDEHVGS